MTQARFGAIRSVFMQEGGVVHVAEHPFIAGTARDACGK